MNANQSFFLALLVGAANLASASDGIVEINHAKVMAAGGYPYHIDAPGSYRLTSNLRQPNPDTDVIRIGSGNVTVDLNGFSLIGSNVCSHSVGGVTCSASGIGAGISALTIPMGASQVGAKISNGRIFGMGGSCLSIGAIGNVKVEAIEVSHCGVSGIYIGSQWGSRVTRSSAVLCAASGIESFSVEDSVVFDCHRGITADHVRESRANNNATYGISALTVDRSSAEGNGTFGIESMMASNSFARVNKSAGIYAPRGGHANGNYAFANAAGLDIAGFTSVPANSNLCGAALC